jgi:hypothetical protein
LSATGPPAELVTSWDPLYRYCWERFPIKRDSRAFEDALEDGDETFLEVAHLVAKHSARIFAEQEEEAERWRDFGGGGESLLLVQRLVPLICPLVWNVAAVGIALLVVALLLG